MGRWTGFKYRLKDGETITIITAYRVCNQSATMVNKSIQTAYKQQKLMLTDDDTATNNDPQKMFIQDMIKLIMELEDPNNYIILMLDASKSIYDSEGGIRKLLKTTSLINTFSIFTGAECTIPTYTRGFHLHHASPTTLY
jgi:hypothetical protein